MTFADTTLTAHTIDTPNDPRFDAVYDCYSKVFTLPSERESRENFEAILEGNADPEVISSKAKELWIYLKDEQGNVVGAANFDVMAGSQTPGYDGSVHAIYVFVDPAYRQQGVFTRLNDEMHRAACDYVKQVLPEKAAQGELNVPILAEQNAPLRMTPEEYLADNEAAGIDQVQRRVVFENEGYRTLGCRYIQPPLSEEQGECTYLDLVTRPGRAGEVSMPSSVIKEHLDRFFTLSFPEGTTRHTEALAEMNESLEQPQINLQPAGRFKTLREHLNADIVAAIPEEQHETPLGELKPELHAILGNPETAPEQGQTFATAMAQGEGLRAITTQTREEIAKRAGGIEGFKQQLVYKNMVSDAENKLLAEHYAGHETAASQAAIEKIEARIGRYHDVLSTGIRIEGELASPDLFKQAVCDNNFTPEVAERLGPSHYFAIGVFDPAHPDKQIGSLGFQVFCHKDGPATIHTSYVVVEPEYRGLGLAQQLNETINKVAIDYIAKARPEALKDGKIYQFIESTPLDASSTKDMLTEIRESMNPVARARMWDEKNNFAPLTCQYYQRSFEEDGKPIQLTLSAQEVEVKQNAQGQYAYAGIARPETVPAAVVNAHEAAFDRLLMVGEYDQLNDRDDFNAMMQGEVAKCGEDVRSLTPKQAKAVRENATAHVHALSDAIGAKPLSDEELGMTLGELAQAHGIDPAKPLTRTKPAVGVIHQGQGMAGGEPQKPGFARGGNGSQSE